MIESRKIQILVNISAGDSGFAIVAYMVKSLKKLFALIRIQIVATEDDKIYLFLFHPDFSLIPLT